MRILQHSRTTSALRKYKTQLIYYNLKDNTEKLTNSLANLYKGSLLRGFKAIWFTSKAWKSERIFKEEREKYIKSFNEAIANKDKEVGQYMKKLDELNNVAISSKNKENELLSKLKSRDKQIASLEQEKSDIMKSKKGPSGDSTAISIKVLEEKV